MTTEVPDWIIVLAFLLFVTISGWQINTYLRRLEYIDSYVWPPGLIDRLTRNYPSLTPYQLDKIERALKQFFRAYHRGRYRPVAMPSQAADQLWHEFILYTKAYDEFCREAFGRFLHHTPAAVLEPDRRDSNEGLRRVWWQACKEERINAWAPQRLPLLFALDADLNIANGYRYVPDCGSVRTYSVEIDSGHQTQCGGDFASTWFDGGTDGLGDSGGD